MNRKLFTIFFVLLSCLPCYAATITRYVNPGSTGGNGTTSALTGANAAYASLSAWEAAEQVDLTINGDIMVVNCAGTTANTGATTIIGWTTSATSYIEIIGDNTTGKWNTGAFRIARTAAGSGLSISEDFVRVSNLQVSVIVNGSISGIIITASNTSADVRIDSCIIKASSVSGNFNRGIRGAGGNTIKIYNTLIYDFTGINDYGIDIDSTSTATVARLWNNTIVDCYTAYLSNSNPSTIAVDCIAQGATDGYNSIDTPTYCISNIANDLSGTGNQNSVTLSFVDWVNDDFHLHSTDTEAIDLGTNDPGSGLYSDDIDGVVRSGTWDIGADEFVAAGGARQRMFVVN